MGMTITEKNMARHAGLDVVKPGQIIECHLDAVLMNDITFPPARKEFLKIANLYLTVIKSTWCLTISHQTKIFNLLHKRKSCAILYANMALQTTLK